jgi:hypothetical protein
VRRFSQFSQTVLKFNVDPDITRELMGHERDDVDNLLQE